MLIAGEAGIGKSTLLSALVQQAGFALSGWGYCAGLGETPTFGPWLEALADLRQQTELDTQLLPRPFGPVPGPWSPQEIAMGLISSLGGLGQPLLLALEDIQWADASSLDLLQAAARRLQRTRLLVVATYRTDTLHRKHPLWTVLPELERLGAQRIFLDRLGPEAVEQWVAAALTRAPAAGEVARRLHQRTGGNPFFVRELLAAALRGGEIPADPALLPETVQQAIDRRLSALTPGAYELLQCAAVIGERFTYDLLARVAGIEEDALLDALEQASALHVIRSVAGASDQLAFDHALVREALLAPLLAPRLRRLHGRVAEALMASRTGDPDLLAYHLTQAGDPRACDALMEAGDHALRLYAPARAAERYRAALELMPDGHERRAEALLKLGAAIRFPHKEEARRLWEEGLQLAPHPAVATWLRYVIGIQMWQQGDPRLPPLLDELEAEEERLQADPLYQKLEADLFGGVMGFPRAVLFRAEFLAAGGRLEEALALVRDRHTAAASDVGRLVVLGLAGWLHLLAGRISEALPMLQEQMELALRTHQYRPGLAAGLNCLLAMVHHQLDRAEELDRLAERLADLEATARERMDFAWLGPGASILTTYLYLRGEWDRARHHLRAWLDQPNPPDVVMWRYLAVLLDLAGGDTAHARRVLEAAPPYSPADDPPPMVIGQFIYNHLAHARLQMAEGNLAGAKAWLESADRWFAQRRIMPDPALLALTWAEWHHRAGNPEAAWGEASRALALAEERQTMLSVLTAHRLLGELAVALRRPAQGLEYLRKSLALAQRCRIPYEAALAQLALARHFPQEPGVREGLEEARQRFEELKATPLAEQAAALLESIPRGPVSQQAGGSPLPDGLTEREAEVVRLVARGLTDREIAAQLYISHRTVDAHLRNIFNKVSVSNRAALAVYASRHGLV